jgi:hypothetical protein
MQRLQKKLLLWSYETRERYDHELMQEELQDICDVYNADIKIIHFANEPEIIGNNCFSFAMDLKPYTFDLPPYKWLAPSQWQVMKWIQNGFIIEDPEGVLMTYWEEDCIAHMGTIQDGIVTSKWGKAHVLQHPVFAAPYGNDLKRYTIVNQTNFVNQWNEIAKVLIEQIHNNKRIPKHAW